MICAPSGATRAHQPQTGAAKAADSSRSEGVLSPGGTRLAPTEAERRPCVSCEAAEQFVGIGYSLKKEEPVLDQLSHIVEASALCQMNRDQLSDETFVPFEMNE